MNNNSQVLINQFEQIVKPIINQQIPQKPIKYKIMLTTSFDVGIIGWPRGAGLAPVARRSAGPGGAPSGPGGRAGPSRS